MGGGIDHAIRGASAANVMLYSVGAYSTWGESIKDISLQQTSFSFFFRDEQEEVF